MGYGDAPITGKVKVICPHCEQINDVPEWVRMTTCRYRDCQKGYDVSKAKRA